MRYRTTKTLWGLPLIDIASGPDPCIGEATGRAKGIIAIGDVATGVVAIGAFARGIIAIGCVCIGVISLGVASLGLLLAVGGCVGIASIAVGGSAIGVVAHGSNAIGLIAWGVSSIGYYYASGGPYYCLQAIDCHNSESIERLARFITFRPPTRPLSPPFYQVLIKMLSNLTFNIFLSLVIFMSCKPEKSRGHLRIQKSLVALVITWSMLLPVLSIFVFTLENSWLEESLLAIFAITIGTIFYFMYNPSKEFSQSTVEEAEIES